MSEGTKTQSLPVFTMSLEHFELFNTTYFTTIPTASEAIKLIRITGASQLGRVILEACFGRQVCQKKIGEPQCGCLCVALHVSLGIVATAVVMVTYANPSATFNTIWWCSRSTIL